MARTFLIAGILSLASFLSAQNGSYIEYKISSSKGANGTIKVKWSDYGSLSDFNMVIPQMPGGGMQFKSLNQNSNPDVIYQLDDKSKTYSEKKKSEMVKDDNKTYTVKKLGEETIAGYKCTHASISDGMDTYEEWNTKEIPGYEKYAEASRGSKGMGSGSKKRDEAVKAAGCEGVPVKTFHKGGERDGDMTMELVKVEKKSFSKSDFDIPAGYTKSAGNASPGGPPQMKSQQEIMAMTPEERAKYIEEMKKQYGK